jgi:uncharacterized membrane protein HdeD (DUF308 family)
MGIGAAVLCFAAGAILYYAVEVDLPYVDDNTLGAILLLAGVIAAIAAVIANTRRSHGGGGTSTGTGVGLLVAGAILYWAIDIDFPFVTDSALGVILMFAGIVTVVATLTMHRQDTKDRLPAPPRAYDHPDYDDRRYGRSHGPR